MVCTVFLPKIIIPIVLGYYMKIRKHFAIITREGFGCGSASWSYFRQAILLNKVSTVGTRGVATAFCVNKKLDVFVIPRYRIRTMRLQTKTKENRKLIFVLGLLWNLGEMVLNADDHCEGDSRQTDRKGWSDVGNCSRPVGDAILWLYTIPPKKLVSSFKKFQKL